MCASNCVKPCSIQGSLQVNDYFVVVFKSSWRLQYEAPKLCKGLSEIAAIVPVEYKFL